MPGFLNTISVTQYIERPSPEMNRLVLELLTQNKLVVQYIDQSCNNPCEKIINAQSKASCGDGKVDPGEECDDAKLGTGNACLSTCKKNICGDGFVFTGSEQCDDGNKNDADACSNTCKLPNLCGNGVINTGEQCDLGTTGNDGITWMNGILCSASCKELKGYCGDARIQQPNGS